MFFVQVKLLSSSMDVFGMDAQSMALKQKRMQNSGASKSGKIESVIQTPISGWKMRAGRLFEYGSMKIQKMLLKKSTMLLESVKVHKPHPKTTEITLETQVVIIFFPDPK